MVVGVGIESNLVASTDCDIIYSLDTRMIEKMERITMDWQKAFDDIRSKW